MYQKKFYVLIFQENKKVKKSQKDLPINLPPERISEICEETISTYTLNEAQASVLRSTLGWFGSAPVINLVHGVFGTRFILRNFF